MKKKAVFLDRDGVINREVDHLNSIRQLRLLPKAAEAIFLLNKSGFVVTIVTNQAAVARGMLTIDGLAAIHAVLLNRLKKKGAAIHKIYYCPHHPEKGIGSYKINCKCRKPNTGMIKKAAKELDLDLKRSFLIGDTTRDILTGKRAGLTTVLVKTGYGGKDGLFNVKPDYQARNLFEAALLITKKV